MSRNALLIVDDQDLGTIYAANLTVYVGLTVYVAGDKAEALKLLGKRNFFDIVISFYSLETSEDIVSSILAAIVSPKLRNNIVVINNLGKKSVSDLIPPAVVYIPNAYDIRNLVRTCAKLLGVTAKYMAELEVPSYFPVSAKLLRWEPLANWEIFQDKEGDSPVKIASQGDPIEALSIQLEEEGVDTVLVRANERLMWVNAVTAKAVLALKSNATPQESLKAAETSLEALSTMLLKSDEDRKLLSEIGKACVAAIDNAIESAGTLEQLLIFMRENQSSYLYLHSVLADYVCRHILKNISWGNSAQIEKMSHVCFFHDIFLVPIFQKYPEVYEVEELAFSNEADDQDLEFILKHAKMAAEQVSQLPKMPMGIDTIILQHHGVKNGEGFSIEPGDDISPLAKVLIIAEAFVNFFMETKDKGQFFGNEGYMTFLKQQYSKRSYQKIIDTLKDFE